MIFNYNYINYITATQKNAKCIHFLLAIHAALQPLQGTYTYIYQKHQFHLLY
jgi:hypothetical protein